MFDACCISLFLPVMQKINSTIHIIGLDDEELMLPGIEFDDIDGYLL